MLPSTTTTTTPSSAATVVTVPQLELLGLSADFLLASPPRVLGSTEGALRRSERHPASASRALNLGEPR